MRWQPNERATVESRMRSCPQYSCPCVQAILTAGHSICKHGENGMALTAQTGAVTLNYPAGAHLFHQGDTDRGIHRIRSGTVTIYRVTQDGHRQIEAFAGQGDYVSLCLSSTSPTSAKALSPVTTRFMGRAAFERCLLEDVDFRREIFHEIDRASAEARRQATLLTCRSAVERVSAFVLDMSAQFRPDEVGFTPIPMSRCEMADYLGLTLETVSRMLNRLKRRGVIDLPRADRFRIKSIAQLRAIAGAYSDQDMIAHVLG